MAQCENTVLTSKGFLASYGLDLQKVKFSKNLRESDFEKNIFKNPPTLPAE